MKTPNPKSQIPKKSHAASSKAYEMLDWNLEFGIWSFIGVWDLGFGLF
jgi:hypothetical protein